MSQAWSIYRGVAEKGLGEGPNLQVEQGEQYLEVEGPLYEEQLLAALRPWMTLDLDPLDHRTLGDALEAWSYLTWGAYRFIVRLRASGHFDKRPAYFAHGRAWRADSLSGQFDIGAYMGQSRLFLDDWDSKRPRDKTPWPAPAVLEADHLRNRAGLAESLLAHLVEGTGRGGHLALSVPLEEFRTRSPLHSLVSFARAALPFPLKKDCRVRIYCRRPARFLLEHEAHLVVIPEDVAEEALTAVPDLVLLQADGGRVAGEPPSSEASSYAAETLRWALEAPAAVLEFSRRIGGLLGPSGTLSSRTLQHLPRTFALSAGGPRRLEERLSLDLERGEESLPWSTVLEKDDLRTFSTDILARLLIGPSGESWKALRQKALAAIRSPSFQALSALKDELNSRLSAADAEDDALLTRAGELHAEELLDSRALAGLSRRHPIERLTDQPDAGRFLQAELEQGELAKRRLGNSELFSLSSNPSLAGVLGHAVAAQIVPSGWVATYLKQDQPAGLLDFASAALREEALLSRPDLAALLLDRLLNLDHVPTELVPSLVEASDQLDPLQRPSLFFDLAQLRLKAGDSTLVEALRKAWPRLHELKDRSARRRLAALALRLEPTPLVDAQGRLDLPSAWDSETADLLLEALPAKLNITSIIRLAAAASDNEIPPAVLSRIDRGLADQEGRRDAVSALIRSGLLPRWRSSTTLGVVELRAAALEWLTSPAWNSSPPPSVSIQDWKGVMADFSKRRLSANELEGLFRQSRPRFPWIVPFPSEQVADLAAACRGWDALARLRELLEEVEIPYASSIPLTESLASAAAHPPPPAWLDLLAGQESSRPLSLDDKALQRLSEESLPTHRRDLLLPALRDRLWSLGAPSWNQLLNATRPLRLMDDEIFRRRLGHRLQSLAKDRSARAALDLVVPDWLDRDLPLRPPLPTAERSKSSALWLMSVDRTRLAEFLWPGIRRDGQTAAIEALIGGTDDMGCWKAMAGDVQRRKPGQVHPVTLLAEELRSLDLSEEQEEQMQRRGWSVFRKAATLFPVLTSASGRPGDRLPALDLAAVLHNDASLGRVASLLIQIQTADDDDQRSWWAELVQGLKNCARRGGWIRAEDWDEAAYAHLRRHLLSAEQGRRKVPKLDRAWSEAG